MQSKPKAPVGIRARHSRTCRAHEGVRCNCRPSYEAFVFSKRDGKKLRKTFPSLAAARGWRNDALGELDRGRLRAPTSLTVREAADRWLEGAREGSVRNRSGDRYKPSAIRSYDAALRLRLLDELGPVRLSEVSRADLQRVAGRLLAKGHSASTIRNTFLPLRAIYRDAEAHGHVAVNPTTALRLPASRGSRDRIAAPAEAARLLDAVPGRDRALWATALYGGLRRGELAALQWSDVDLAGGVLRVERSWDFGGAADKELVDPKSSSGSRRVPIPAVLRDELLEHRLREGREEGLIFGRAYDRPFEPSGVSRRAQTAWKGAKLEALTLHEARHTFASLMIAAGVNAKALSSYMGHASITITLDRYGHLMPGNEEEAAALLDAYLDRERARAARSAGTGEPLGIRA